MNKERQKDFRRQIADMFVNALESKQLEWKMEWSGGIIPPYNAVSGTRYKGINQFILSLTAMLKGYTDPRWATFKQISDEGWKLKKDSKSTKIEFWYPFHRLEGKSLTWHEYNRLPPEEKQVCTLYAKYYSVFNAAQISGIPELQVIPRKDIEPDILIETLSKNMGVEIINGGNECYYRPSEDKIYMPLPEMFESSLAYNSTALHELAHSTGHPSRLNRNLSGGFGSEAYAYEELVAEISSAFMNFNLPAVSEAHMKNHTAYVQSWIQAVKDKPDTLYRAIKEAERVADYMENSIELEQEKMNETEKQEVSSLDKPSYRDMVQAIYEYEVEQNVPEYLRLTKWYEEENISVAKPFNDNGAISEQIIAQRYSEISNMFCGRVDATEVAVFITKEDAQAHMELDKLRGQDVKATHRIAIGNAKNLEALSAFLAQHPNVTEIICCMDSTDTEEENAKALVKCFGIEYSVSVELPEGESWADELDNVQLAQPKVVEQSYEMEL